MEFLEAIDAEWSQMWELLSLFPINRADPVCLNNGLAWEYMGSTCDHHIFKHELHPLTQKSEYIYIERHCAGVNWGNNDAHPPRTY